MKVGAKEQYNLDDTKRWRTLLREGYRLKTIALMEGVSEGTISKWLLKDARGEI